MFHFPSIPIKIKMFQLSLFNIDLSDSKSYKIHAHGIKIVILEKEYLALTPIFKWPKFSIIYEEERRKKIHKNIETFLLNFHPLLVLSTLNSCQ